VIADIHDEWAASERRYFSDTSMVDLYPERDDDDATPKELALIGWWPSGDYSLNPPLLHGTCLQELGSRFNALHRAIRTSSSAESMPS
jgi:hypothetical protein